jgi:hypothetical protein
VRLTAILLAGALAIGAAELMLRATIEPPKLAGMGVVRAPVSPCGRARGFEDAAAQNAASSSGARWSVFGRLEIGWRTYAPLAAHEVGAPCPAQSEDFAAALAAWQHSHGLAATGVMDEATLRALDLVWLRRRPFVAASAHGACPAPPPESELAWAQPEEGYRGKRVQLRSSALSAYRRMVAAARAETSAIAADPRLLTIVSGYRGPAEETARCAEPSQCGAPVRASCSAHRTGLAMDIFVGAAPGYAPASSADANRMFQSQNGGLPMAGRQRRPIRVHQLSVRAVALGVDGRAALRRLGRADTEDGRD